MGLRELLDRIGHLVEKGGKYEKFHAIYEAIDTFHFRPASVTRTTAHVRDGIDLKRMMVAVWVCTFPVIFFGMWNIGFQANKAFSANPELLATQDNWRMALVRMLASFDPASAWDNIVQGATWFLPIYIVTFAVGIAWQTRGQ